MLNPNPNPTIADRVLVYIRAHPKRDTADMAQALGMTAQQVSDIVSALRSKGLIETRKGERS